MNSMGTACRLTPKVMAWAKPKRRGKSSDRVPAAEDQGGQRDKAAAVGHALGEGGEQAHREVHAAEGGQDARESHAVVAHPGDADARGVYRFRNLAGGPQPEAERRVVDDEEGYREERVH